MTENQLYNYVVDKAHEFGMKAKNDCNKTSNITTENGNAIIRHNTGDNPYFAFIDKNEDTSGRYNGLSFVVFPNKVEDEIVTHCVISIGIGSSTLGNDTALACSPGFRRSFMKLIANNNCQFFFAENWGDMETRTPGLKEAVALTSQPVLISSINSYDDNSTSNRVGLLPAACLLTFNEDFDINDGIPILDAWLAQYAKWRTWDSTQSARDSIEQVINLVRCPAKNNETLAKEVKDLLDQRRYVVLQGAPGCGKTRMALHIASEYSPEYVTFTQFHAETTYADFVYGIKPTLNGKDLGYEGVKGVLLEAIEKAKQAAKQGQKALLIIDEINRANLSNVLGPVFYLFEANAQDHDYKINLGTISNPGSNNPNCQIEKIEIDRLPDNLHVIATMNTADRSLAVVDFALRRRFVWYTLFPKVVSKEELPTTKYFDEKRFNEFNEIFEKYATDDELNLQPGQSYFILEKEPEHPESISEEMKYRLQYELMPLIKEYLNEGFLLKAKQEFSHLFFKYTKEYMYK